MPSECLDQARIRVVVVMEKVTGLAQAEDTLDLKLRKGISLQIFEPCPCCVRVRVGVSRAGPLPAGWRLLAHGWKGGAVSRYVP